MFGSVLWSSDELTPFAPIMTFTFTEDYGRYPILIPKLSQNHSPTLRLSGLLSLLTDTPPHSWLPRL